MANYMTLAGIYADSVAGNINGRTSRLYALLTRARYYINQQYHKLSAWKALHATHRGSLSNVPAN